mmetsp:Transcript_5755/g.17860  ORF Transcript_5755/g.17860 Transcript_5755/m.17860 type:complete len:403 (+) Transcript_5755:60-1268(+)
MSTPSLLADEVKQFIAAHNLDDSAKSKLEGLSLEQQIDVISQDSSNVRNMNAVVISRANKSQREGPQFTGTASQEYIGGIVSKFIETYNLDEKSSNALRGLPPRDQVTVIAKDMDGVTNPSGVVDSRVRKLLREGPAFAAGMPSKAVAMPQSAPLPVDATQYLEQAYRTFVAQYGLDQKAQDVVAQLTPLQKLEVISQGMENVWNPSGAISSRCTKVQGRPVVLGPRAVQWVAEVVQLFCQSYGIDISSDAYQLMQKLPADKQFEVCSASLAGARNPQSVMYCRIQKLGPNFVQANGLTPQAAPAPKPSWQSPVGSGGAAPRAPAPDPGPFVGSVDTFIATYSLDDRAATALRDLAAKDPSGADEVMSQPITAEVRNPSGVIHARITKRGAGVSMSARSSPY